MKSQVFALFALSIVSSLALAADPAGKPKVTATSICKVLLTKPWTIFKYIDQAAADFNQEQRQAYSPPPTFADVRARREASRDNLFKTYDKKYEEKEEVHLDNYVEVKSARGERKSPYFAQAKIRSVTDDLSVIDFKILLGLGKVAKAVSGSLKLNGSLNSFELFYENNNFYLVTTTHSEKPLFQVGVNAEDTETIEEEKPDVLEMSTRERKDFVGQHHLKIAAGKKPTYIQIWKIDGTTLNVVEHNIRFKTREELSYATAKIKSTLGYHYILGFADGGKEIYFLKLGKKAKIVSMPVKNFGSGRFKFTEETSDLEDKVLFTSVVDEQMSLVYFFEGEDTLYADPILAVPLAGLHIRPFKNGKGVSLDDDAEALRRMKHHIAAASL